jgi:hypothetical protein
MKFLSQLSSTRGVALMLGLAACVTSSGCLSTKYRLAPKSTLPPAGLNLAFTQPPLEAQLHSVIVCKGPGSWKREAMWDEYVLTLTNRSSEPLVIDSALLTDFQGEATPPGDDPWRLEKVSQSWWKKAQIGPNAGYLALGVGTAISASVLASAAGASAVSAAEITAAGSAVVATATVVVVALPVYAITIGVMNHNNKQAVAAEFTRRRLVLPLTLPPGQSTQGSLFFRISPGPRTLVWRLHATDEWSSTAMNLQPLAQLHFTAAP